MTIEQRLKMLLMNGKLELWFAILYVAGLLWLWTSFFVEVQRDSFALVLFPFFGTVTIIALISVLLKVLTYRNAVLAIKMENTDQAKRIKNSAKRTFESAVLDLTAVFIYTVYSLVYFIRQLNFGVVTSWNVNGVDEEIKVNAIIAVIVFIIMIIKTILNSMTFIKIFKYTSSKENK